MNKRTGKILQEMFERLFRNYGPQHWWPGEGPLEVMIGAILTQNTSWKNVEKAIANLKKAGAIEVNALLKMSEAGLAELIRPAGYFNVKATRLRNFLEFFQKSFGASITKMRKIPTDRLREQLLSVKGIGPETADSILLYALGHSVFVVDAYTYRVFTRHFLASEESGYDQLQEIAGDNVPADPERYNEFHALLVAVGKEFCGTTPKCEECPLKGLNW